MSQVKGIPYGISDFNRMRNENFYFVDKTMYLPLIEEMPSYLFLIRPRRFGKSLFLSMMRTYYDIAQKDNFDKYFGDLWIVIRLKDVTITKSFSSTSQKQAVLCREQT